MNPILSFAFIGGDLRQIPVIEQFLASGHEVMVFGLEQASLPASSLLKICSSLSDAINDAKVVVLPLPYRSDENHIHTPLSEAQIPIQELFSLMKPAQLLFAGRTDGYLKALSELYGVRFWDYSTREEMAILNAIPTVEGALAIAMAETPHTIHQSRCLVLGYGRIGKLLAHTLKALGANVCAAARKPKDLAWMVADSIFPIPFKGLGDAVGDFDIIFNTVPDMVLPASLLAKVPDRCLVIDLASKPGGVDFEAARRMGKKVIWALSLPGKVAPETAGIIIKDTIVNILEELGVSP
ncbi:MAG: dipicolinate synthase subunit DpsA [Clostridia bacterium]|nr:dipicolinate synthase subunit DpsA [Clostridia bacterium]